MEPNTTMDQATNKKSHGALIGSIIIVVILIIGGIYVFKMTKKSYEAQQDIQAVQDLQAEDEVVQNLQEQSSSDDLDSIDSDLNATEFDSLDSDITIQ